MMLYVLRTIKFCVKCSIFYKCVLRPHRKAIRNFKIVSIKYLMNWMRTECINCNLKYSYWTEDIAQTKVIRLRRIFSLRALSYKTCRKKGEIAKVKGRANFRKCVRVCLCVHTYIRKWSTLDNMHLSQQSMFCRIVRNPTPTSSTTIPRHTPHHTEKCES